MEGRPFDKSWETSFGSVSAHFYFGLSDNGLDLPPWAFKAIDKIRRIFFWKGRKDAKNGHYLVAWTKVCCPLEFGGLGISNLQNLVWTLHMGCLWFQKTEPN